MQLWETYKFVLSWWKQLTTKRLECQLILLSAKCCLLGKNITSSPHARIPFAQNQMLQVVLVGKILQNLIFHNLIIKCLWTKSKGNIGLPQYNTASGLYKYLQLPGMELVQLLEFFLETMKTIMTVLCGACVLLDDILMTGKGSWEEIVTLPGPYRQHWKLKHVRVGPFAMTSGVIVKSWEKLQLESRLKTSTFTFCKWRTLIKSMFSTSTPSRERHYSKTRTVWIFLPEMEFLGRWVDKDDFKPIVAKVKAIKNATLAHMNWDHPLEWRKLQKKKVRCCSSDTAMNNYFVPGL